jgi:hypothetical protein
MLALGVEEGVFVIVAAAPGFAAVQAFARYQAHPLPRFVANGGYLNAQALPSGQTVYTAYVPWPGVTAGQLQMGCITADKRKPVFQVNCIPYASFTPELLLELLQRFGRTLLPAFEATLGAEHGLRKLLTPPAKPRDGSAFQPQGHLDGVLDGIVHGWLADPALGSAAITVELVRGDQVVASGAADYYLETATACAGRHRFRLRLSYELFDGQVHGLRIRPLETGVYLPGPPIPLKLPLSPTPDLDCIPRDQTLLLAQQLGRTAKVNNHRAEQILIKTFAQACLQQETGLLHEARNGYQRLAQVLGVNALCHCKLGETWLLDNQPKAALAAYRAAGQLAPQLFWAHLGQGNAMRLLGQTLAAQDAYRNAIECAPNATVAAPAKRRLADIRIDALAARLVQRIQADDKSGAIAMLQDA